MRKLILCLSRLSLFMLLGTSLVGCALPQRTLPPVAEKMPIEEKIEIKEQPLAPMECTGSLYEARSSFNSFFIDTKARQVGDIVTVEISESSKATNSADTKTGRTSSLEAGIDRSLRRGALDHTTRAHLEESRARIRKTLDAQVEHVLVEPEKKKE